MAILMNLNHNGQAITLSNQLKDKGATDGAKLKALVDKEKREYTFAQTFPTGTHAMWIYYWLAANGIIRSTTSRRSSCRRRRWSPTCASATWTGSASASRGTTARSTTRSASPPRRRRAVWKDHPEKTLGTTLEFVQKNPNTTRAMIAAVLDASKYIDVMANRKKVSEIIADKSYVNCPVDDHRPAPRGQLRQRDRQAVEGSRLHEVLQRRVRELPVPVRRHVVHDAAPAVGPAQGRPGLPRRGEEGEPDRHLQAGGRDDQDAGAEGRDAQPKLIDGVVWDGKDPKAYAAGFKLKSVGA
jgi:nitrate/nitrite transport system substrate-binding protein